MDRGHEPLDDAQIAGLAQKLLRGEFSKLSEREQRVIATIARRQPAARNVNHAADADATFGERLADRVAGFGGSWTFIVLFVAGLAGWIGLNLFMFKQFGDSFDAYPFIFLNLILSMVAALQAPVILMSQNRQSSRDRISAGLDYEINLKCELEIMTLHDKLDALRIDRLEQMLEDQQARLQQILELVGDGKVSNER
ncbi:MAG: DUF1003 domain-containing protein [Burkholderiales bacterium]|nr:MAG: DUF1003 domain-containing protein [Burkholderiales bacterium]